MSKLYDLLNTIIGKVNKSVKTDAQTLTEEQKAQARSNIGAAAEGEGGSGGVSVQSDWNQTDETAADFIKNKPFGDEVVVNTVPETEVTGVDAGGVYQVDIDTVFSGNDETLVVTFDGVEYHCAAVFMNDFILYGNMVFLGMPDTGEPFMLFINPMSLTQMLMFDANTHVVSIGKPSVETIAEEYLPVIPLEKVPGSIKLYVDAENYLYEGGDTSDTSKRLTRRRLREILEYGQAIYIQVDVFSVLSPVDFQIGSDAVGYSTAICILYNAVTKFYTAEYTAE